MQLIAALVDIPNAVVRVVALMVIKYTNEVGGSVMLQRQLTSMEIRALERNPGSKWTLLAHSNFCQLSYECYQSWNRPGTWQ